MPIYPTLATSAAAVPTLSAPAASSGSDETTTSFLDFLESPAAATASGDEKRPVLLPFGSLLEATENDSWLDREYVSLEDIQRQSEKLLRQFEADLRKILRHNDISLSDPVRLRVAADGRVEVVGEHPNKEAIERIFAENSELRDTFVELSANMSLLQAAQRHDSFTAAYADNPTEAAARFLDAPPEVFQLLVTGEEATVEFV